MTKFVARRINSALLSTAALSIMVFATGTTEALASNMEAQAKQPALIITNAPLPQDLHDQVYNKPGVAPEISPDIMMNAGYAKGNLHGTIVGSKVNELRNDLFDLQGDISRMSGIIQDLEDRTEVIAANYYSNTGTINTQLQSGTTPGNPRLVTRLSEAQDDLEELATNVVRFDEMAIELSRISSLANYLLENVYASYNISGAIEEDHVRLSELEDAISGTLVVVERLANKISDDVTRTSGYLSSERSNLRTLSLAVSRGDLYGKSLSNRPFSGISPANFTPDGLRTATPPSPRPLVKIRFNKQSVAYEQPVYVAVSQAMERYPAARFELIAVHPAGGNAAKTAIESTKARRNAEKVLRTLTQMGLPLDRIDLSYSPSTEAVSSEVHIYVR